MLCCWVCADQAGFTIKESRGNAEIQINNIVQHLIVKRRISMTQVETNICLFRNHKWSAIKISTGVYPSITGPVQVAVLKTDIR